MYARRRQPPAWRTIPSSSLSADAVFASLVPFLLTDAGGAGTAGSCPQPDPVALRLSPKRGDCSKCAVRSHSGVCQPFLSSTSVFAMLVRNINIAWQHAGKQSFFHQRLLRLPLWVADHPPVCYFHGRPRAGTFQHREHPFCVHCRSSFNAGRIGTYVVPFWTCHCLLWIVLVVPRVSVKKSAEPGVPSSARSPGRHHLFLQLLPDTVCPLRIDLRLVREIVAFLAWIYLFLEKCLASPVCCH